MVLTIDAMLEAVLKEQANRQGLAPEELALKLLRERLIAAAPPAPRDEWERETPSGSPTLGSFPPRCRLDERGAIRLMAFLLDTSILVRLANVDDAQHPVAARAVLELHRRSEILYVAPQVLVEFRNVATRPKSANGAGLPIVDAETHAATFEAKFALLAETPAIFVAWKALVGALGIIGKQVHDARIIAVCHVYAVAHVLTFNVGHFGRMAAFGPSVVVVDPATV